MTFKRRRLIGAAGVGSHVGAGFSHPGTLAFAVVVAKFLGWIRQVPAVLRVGARPISTARDLANADLQRAFPAYWAERRRYLVAALIVWLTAVVVSYFTTWWIAAVIAGLFLLVALVLAWRRRVHWGARRGWPPGSVGVGPAAMIDHEYFVRQARQIGPMAKGNHFRDPMVAIMDLDLATSVFRTAADDLGPMPLWYNRFIPGGGVRWADEPRHSELRRLFARALSARYVDGVRPVLADAVRRHLARMAADPDASDRGVAPLEAIREMVWDAWSGAMLGIPANDPEFAEAAAHADALDIYREVPPPDREVEARLDRLAAMVRARAASGLGLAAEIELLEPDALTDLGVMRNLLYNVSTTREDVAGLVMWVVKNLADHPEWVAEVRATDPDDSSVVRRVVSESLRLDQSEYLFRRARSDIGVGDLLIPKDWVVRVCIREIHRDPARFPHADQFDPDRFRDGGCGRDVYAPFGIDHHACVGETLTRAMTETFARELALGYDLAVTADGPREVSAHRHWAPNRAFRLQIHARLSAG